MSMRWIVLLACLLAGCMRSWVPDTVTVTAIGADPTGIPQPHVAISVTYFLSPTHILMESTTTTLPLGIH